MDYPIIDWELSTKLAGNCLQAAQEMVSLLIKMLPHDLAQIKEAYIDNQHEQLSRYVHRLHGALCYCGVPRLKAATYQLETALKRNKKQEISILFDQFEQEAKKLLTTNPLTNNLS
jgi:two-component system, NarL family, sensor histidine kinase BarA